MVALLKKSVLTINLNFELALHFVFAAAQHTDTARNILSSEGVYMKKHLLGGVKKGAFDEATAEAKFNAWKTEKQNKLNAVSEKLASDKKAAYEARIASEKKTNEEIAKKVAEKKAAAEAAKAEAAQTEEAAEEAPAEA